MKTNEYISRLTSHPNIEDFSPKPLRVELSSEAFKQHVFPCGTSLAVGKIRYEVHDHHSNGLPAQEGQLYVFNVGKDELYDPKIHGEITSWVKEGDIVPYAPYSKDDNEPPVHMHIKTKHGVSSVGPMEYEYASNARVTDDASPLENIDVQKPQNRKLFKLVEYDGTRRNTEKNALELVRAFDHVYRGLRYPPEEVNPKRDLKTIFIPGLRLPLVIIGRRVDMTPDRMEIKPMGFKSEAKGVIINIKPEGGHGKYANMPYIMEPEFRGGPFDTWSINNVTEYFFESPMNGGKGYIAPIQTDGTIFQGDPDDFHITPLFCVAFAGIDAAFGDVPGNNGFYTRQSYHGFVVIRVEPK